MNTTTETLDLLLDFQSNCTQAEFRAVFGETLGDHLWRRFYQRGGNLLSLYSTLDASNAARLVDHLNQRATLLTGVLQ